jgi:type II secretory pathway pseudopilin PulG
MSKARDQDGFALVAAMALLFVMIGLGLGLLLFVDTQQKASAREQASEGAFNVAEAALNAQVGQLSRKWPSSGEPAPTRCTSSEAYSAASICPSPASIESAYKYLQSTATCTGTEPWGSPLSNQWTTYVRDDGPSEVAAPESPLFSSSVSGYPFYDKNGDNKLWIRSVGVVQCHPVSIVTLVAQQTVALNLPEDVATGAWFKVTNSGKKTIVNRKGEEPQPGPISMRGCTSAFTAPCEYEHGTKEQVSPELTENPPSASVTLSSTALETVKSEAIAHGTYYTKPNCPTSMAQLTGSPVYIEGCEALKITANGTANSLTTPGFLVVANGTLEMGGTSTFYGIIYAANLNSEPLASTAIVKLQGKTNVVGEILVDGKGGIELGSSGEGGGNSANLTFSAKAARGAHTSAGATPTRNSFRILPSGQ